MRQAKINKERARRAELALKAQDYWDCGESYAAADLIDDIMHLCIREKWDFEQVLESARMHFEAEHSAPDDIELCSARPMFKAGDYPIVREDENRVANVRNILATVNGNSEPDQMADALAQIEKVIA